MLLLLWPVSFEAHQWLPSLHSCMRLKKREVEDNDVSAHHWLPPKFKSRPSDPFKRIQGLRSV
ncbi:hypothetical protein A2U01_0055361 [Trifolium medium]|uniref:Uncharacterized protein n=1 Tax=Trifolium medium TaxID=97028 RepID=A0A392RBZ0_9FABA|nr:hypothetical protein [Trifolium medium]